MEFCLERFPHAYVGIIEHMFRSFYMWITVRPPPMVSGKTVAGVMFDESGMVPASLRSTFYGPGWGPALTPARRAFNRKSAATL